LSALREPSATNKTGVATAAALPARPVPGAGGVSANKRDLYLVVDLAGGEKAKSWPVSYLAGEPKGGWSDEYKTDKLLLRRIEPGTFDMGSPEDEPGRDSGETQHKVTLTKPFYIGVFEVTQRQWELVMGSTPSAFKANSDMCPVEQVSYLDIRENPDNSDDPAVDWPVNSTVNTKSFMGKLRARTGKAFDLPTEAQWEYACRAGTTGAYAGKGGLDNQAWYQDNASGKTHPVGQKGANAWGLYDMHGNVWEWCLDWLGTYPGTVSDPKGASPGSFRVDRGGSWDYYAGYCRTANRDGSNPDRRRSHVGFRAVVPAGQ
ncbi:MAG: formylglycine-generating enzyme family protein, partial [bacterium]